MNNRGPIPAHRRGTHAGFSLAEILVATAVFAVAVGVAFILYNAAQGSYKEGEQFTQQQQGTRVAFDRIVSELRMSGYNYNPDGNSLRPDEQIEGAWDTAITFRGDFDFEITPADDPVRNNEDPETTLTGTFNVVSTGNDEIVTYALGKPDGSGGEDLEFFADVQEATRDGDVEQVRINNIHLIQNDPPYTLYRIHLSNDETDYGNWGDFAIKEPIVDNIKSLQFRYYDSQGAQLNTFDLTQSSDDIGGAETAGALATRSIIRRVEVDIVGLTPNPDPDYTDPDDAIAATQKYRKFQLTTDVVSQNLGYKGMPDLVVGNPREPQNVTLCTGHCEGMIVEWDNVHEAEDFVTEYTVWYGTDPSALDTPIDSPAQWAWVGNLLGGPFYFGVQAKNSAGKLSAITSAVSGTPVNDTRPLPIPSGTLWASGGADPAHPFLDNRIDLGWDTVNENTSEGASEAVSGCDPQRPVNRDLAGFRVYRGDSSGFVPGTPVATETDLAGITEWSDNYVVNCQDFYYVVKAVDSCGAESDASEEVLGYAETEIPPAAPANVSAAQNQPFRVDVAWDPVTQDTSDPPRNIAVAGYNVYVAEWTGGVDPESIPESSYFLMGSEIQGTTYEHWVSYVPPGMSVYFKVTAVDACPNESAKSNGSEYSCDFSGDLVYNLQDGDNVAGVVPLFLDIIGPQSYTRGQIRVRDSLGTDFEFQESFSLPLNFDWNTAALPPGLYDVLFEVENGKGCIRRAKVTVQVNTSVTCCIGAANPEFLPLKGNASDSNSDLAFDISNNCGKDVEITGLNISWTEIYDKIAALQTVQFPTGTVVWTFLPEALTPATVDLKAAPLFLSMFNDALSPLNMTLDWDQAMAGTVSKVFVTETVNVQFGFRAVDATEQGVCTIQVVADELTIK